MLSIENKKDNFKRMEVITILNLEEKFYTAKYDKVFKAIFCNPKNIFLLQTLLERCLNMEIEILKVTPPEMIAESVYEKGKTLDVLVKTEKEIINIEVNSGFREEMHSRLLGYLCNTYSEDIKVGESYADMPTVIQINFTWNLPQKYPVLGQYNLQDSETKMTFANTLKIFEYNMDKIKKLWYSGDREYDFLAILDFDKEELKQVEEGDAYMEKFKENVEKLNDDYEFKEFLSKEEDERKIRNTFKVLGKREGAHQSKVEIAQNMLKEKMSIAMIAKVTGLSEEEIKALN